MAQYGERQADVTDHMSDAEALMWNVEKDPWLASAFGTVAVTETPIDPDRLRRRLAVAAASIPRLRARVAPRVGRCTAPTWQTDPEFDLTYHVRRTSLPEPGDDATLFDVCCHLVEDPFDRTRPLWQFHIIEGLTGGRGALLIKLHHSVTDGVGAIRLAELYMDADADAPDSPEVDLDAIVAREVGDTAAPSSAADPSTAATDPDGQALAGALGAVLHGAAETARGPLGVARRLAGDVMLAMADPARLPEMGGSLVAVVRNGAAQLDTSQQHAHSSLWARRSRKRTLRAFQVDLDGAKAAADAFGVSLNDLFVAATVLGAGRYHQQLGVELDQVTLTFAVSTRRRGESGGNAFSPAKATVPTGMDRSVAELVEAVHDELAERKAEVGGGGGLLASLAGAVNLLPTSLVTRLARQQALSVDLATSNVRAAPFTVYLGGARVEACYPVGPVAGTAFNLTMMSYAGTLGFGLHVDPVAVAEPDRLRDALVEAFATLLAGEGATATRRVRSGERASSGDGRLR